MVLEVENRKKSIADVHILLSSADKADKDQLIRL
jgi:hypothetical protein